MPKFLLKCFQNKYNHLYYYDVEKQLIGTKGSAKNINTAYGYYSPETEKFLEKEIEAPFGKILKYLNIKEFGEKTEVVIDFDIAETTLNFIYALVVRSPSFHKMMISEENILNTLSAEDRRNYIIQTGIRIAKENNLLHEYIVTFIINHTDIPFVLSMNGIYNYTLNGYPVINLPISPNVTISLIHKDYSHKVIQNDGAVTMYQILNPENIMLMNNQAFSFQVMHNWGYVVSPEKSELERLSLLHRND